MNDKERRTRLQDRVNRIEALAKSKGCEMTLEFELCAVRWGAELAAGSQDDQLACTVLREADELESMLEGDSARSGMGAAAEVRQVRKAGPSWSGTGGS